MSRVWRRERARQNRARAVRFSQDYQTAPVHERGVAFLALWANAMVATILNAVLAVVVIRAARTSWRNRRSGLACALRAGFSKTPVWVVSAMLIHQQVARLWVMPIVERIVPARPGSSLPPSS